MTEHTPERRWVRMTLGHLNTRQELLNAQLKGVQQQITELQRGCPHSARESGSLMGTSWWTCPDCGSVH